MNIQHTDRRASDRQSEYGAKFDANAVRHGLAVQRRLNTSSAVEYLKANGVDGAVINRVLSSQTVRGEDRLYLDLFSEGPGV
jgi:hypothetical protein